MYQKLSREVSARELTRPTTTPSIPRPDGFAEKDMAAAGDSGLSGGERAWGGPRRARRTRSLPSLEMEMEGRHVARKMPPTCLCICFLFYIYLFILKNSF